MKASTKRALTALENGAKAILAKLETLRDEEQEHLDDLDHDSPKVDEAEEVVCAFDDAIRNAEDLVASLESFV